MTTLNIIQYNDKTTSCLVMGEMLKDFAKYTTTKDKYPVAVFRIIIKNPPLLTEDSFGN